MKKSKIPDLVSKLRELDQRELVYVLSKVLPQYEPYKEDPVVSESAFFLGVAYKEEAEAKISVIAYPDPEEYGDDLGPNYGFCQGSGNSEWQGVEYVSNFKNGISPFTGKKIRMT